MHGVRPVNVLLSFVVSIYHTWRKRQVNVIGNLIWFMLNKQAKQKWGLRPPSRLAQPLPHLRIRKSIHLFSGALMGSKKTTIRKAVNLVRSTHIHNENEQNFHLVINYIILWPVAFFRQSIVRLQTSTVLSYPANVQSSLLSVSSFTL